MDWRDEAENFIQTLNDVGFTLSKDNVSLLAPGLAQKLRSYYNKGRMDAGKDMTLKIGRVIQAIVSE